MLGNFIWGSLVYSFVYLPKVIRNISFFTMIFLSELPAIVAFYLLILLIIVPVYVSQLTIKILLAGSRVLMYFVSSRLITAISNLFVTFIKAVIFQVVDKYINIVFLGKELFIVSFLRCLNKHGTEVSDRIQTKILEEKDLPSGV